MINGKGTILLDVEWTHTSIQTTLHQIMIMGQIHKSAENQKSWGVDIRRQPRFLSYEQEGCLCETFFTVVKWFLIPKLIGKLCFQIWEILLKFLINHESFSPHTPFQKLEIFDYQGSISPTILSLVTTKIVNKMCLSDKLNFDSL